ncbi:MAG: peptide synthase, partial [Marinobacter sp.]
MSQKESHLLLPVDSAWLALERPENPMTITVMLRVEGLTEARLLEFLRIYWLAWER